MAERLARVKSLKDTTENWEKANPVLLDGEIAFEIMSDGFVAIKVGDGKTAWKDLEYVTKKPSELGNKLVTYQNVAEMKKDESLSEGDYVQTLGYHTANDGGGAFYRIRKKETTDVEICGNLHEIGDLVAEIDENKNRVNVLQRGCKADDATDNATILNRIISDSTVTGLYFPKGMYRVETPVVLKNNLTISGDGMDLSKIRGLGEKILQGSETRNYRVVVEKIAFFGNESNIGLSYAFGYSRLSEVAIQKCAVAIDALYGTWITEMRDLDIRNCAIGIKTANEINALDICNVTMEDISDKCIQIEQGRNVAIHNSRFERCAEIVYVTAGVFGFTISENYFENCDCSYHSGMSTIAGDVTLSNNYYIDFGGKNGFMVKIETVTSVETPGSKIRIINNSITKYPTTISHSKPIAFVEYTGTSTADRFCNKTIEFTGNYFIYGKNDFKSFVDLIDFTNCKYYMTVMNRPIVVTDYEIGKWTEQPNTHFRAIPSPFQDLTYRNQRYRVYGTIAVADATGNSVVTVNITNGRIRPLTAQDIIVTLEYSDETLQTAKATIGAGVVAYGVDASKVLKKIHLDCEYYFNMVP